MDRLQLAPAYGCFTKSAVAAGTTTTLSQTTAAHYAIGGKLYKQASAWSNQATPTTDVNTGANFVGVPINNGSVFVIGVNAAGTMKVAQGPLQALDTSGKFILAPQFPALPEDFCPLAYLELLVASNGSTWTFGSSNNSGVTGVTYNFQDISTLPGRPQVS